jgi:hypothetical protein
MSKNLGYGICGMKNSYSGTALLDNWVEDRYGCNIAAAGDRPGYKSYVTNTMDTFCDPKDMEVHPNNLNIKLESVKDLKARNKDGMPYNLLFMNENGLEGPRFQTTLQRVQASVDPRYSQRDGLRILERNKELRRERSHAKHTTSTYSQANRRMDPGSPVPNIIKGAKAELPNFRRIALISGWAK